MAFSDYRKYTAAELKSIFRLDIQNKVDLFPDFTPSGQKYEELQKDVNEMAARFRLSKSDNEATRGSLLVSRVLWKAGSIYGMGVFFEPNVVYQADASLNLPHSLSGAYDGGLSLDEFDFISPIVSVVEVKRSSLSDGLGQCIAEMYTTIHLFNQQKVYGIITDGETWEFMRLEGSVISVDPHNYYSKFVSDIVDRIGYIATKFDK